MSEIIDNRAHRVRTLKDIIQHLHAGCAPAEVKEQLAKIVRETDYSEIVAMEQELLAEGMPVEEIQSMCDLHSQVTRDVLVQLPAKPIEPGHPADTFRRENAALRDVLAKMRAALGESPLALRQAFNELMDIEKHYQRKEHAIFPKLEAHGITGPPKVMWAKDDEVRASLKDLARALGKDAATAGETAEAAMLAVEEMIYKEDRILIPMCLDAFTEEDWAEIWSASPRYGWCLVEPQEGYRPSPAVMKKGLALATAESITLPTGTLSVDQLIALFSTLPVDITFVDADDRVAFFSEGPDRVFSRSRTVIGRKVQYCHPPRSVSIVDRILSDFREGRQNVAEFWIDFQGRFVHIRYFPLRNEKGEYLGTLEVTQDITGIRKLEGERRLLEYESAA
jgi:uncharacterized protein